VAALDLTDVERPRWAGGLHGAEALPAEITQLAADAASATLVLGHGGFGCADGGAHGQGVQGISVDPQATLVDAGDPARPAVRGHLALPDFATDVATWQGTAFVAAGEGGLRVLDLAGAGAPREIAALEDDGEPALAVALDWPYLWLGGHRSLRLVDVRAPARPRALLRRDLPSEVTAMTLHHGVLWVATREAGLLGFAAGP
jgi:hypothetical protein